MQIYVAAPGKAAERAAKLLKGFQRVSLAPGETRTVRMEISLPDISWWNPATRSWTMESGAHLVMAGGSSDAARLLRASIDL